RSRSEPLRMTQDEANPNDEIRKQRKCSPAAFKIRASSLIRHSSFVILFNRVPDLVHFHEIYITESFPLPLHFVLQSIETGDEFVSRALQRAFRIEFAFPCEIDDCEEQISYFVLDRFPILLQDGL